MKNSNDESYQPVLYVKTKISSCFKEGKKEWMGERKKGRKQKNMFIELNEIKIQQGIDILNNLLSK